MFPMASPRSFGIRRNKEINIKFPCYSRAVDEESCSSEDHLIFEGRSRDEDRAKLGIILRTSNSTTRQEFSLS